MSLYKDYLEETFGKTVIETEDGYISYLIQGNECYVETVYVIPDKREAGVGSRFVDQVSEIAKSAGATFISTTINPAINDPTRSMKAILACGFKFHSCDQFKILFTKELT